MYRHQKKRKFKSRGDS